MIIFLLLSLIFGSLNALYTDKAQLTVQKEDRTFANYIIDQVSYVNDQRNWTEFFIPLIPVTWKFSRGVNYPILDKFKEHLVGFPFIGPYMGTPIRSKQRLALILFPENNIIDFLPNIIKNKLADYFTIQPEQRAAALQNKTIMFSAMILSDNLIPPTPNPANDSYNIRMHWWIAQWHSEQEKKSGNFKENIQLGIFQPQGLIEVQNDLYVPFDGFNSQDVNFHDQHYYSPDNAKFKIDTKNAFSSFWLVGVSADKKHISVTYILIANSEPATQFIGMILNESQNIDQLYKKIHQELPKISFDIEGKKIATDWVDMVYDIAKNVNPLATLTMQLQALSNHLTMLQNKLTLLKK